MIYSDFMSGQSNRKTGTTNSSPLGRNCKIIGAFFQKHRLSAGLSLADAAKSLDGVSPRLLAAYEAGEKGIPLEMIFSLTNLYNVPPEDTLLMVLDLHSENGSV